MTSDTHSDTSSQHQSTTATRNEPSVESFYRDRGIPVPDHNETLATRVLPESKRMTGKRRVERVYRNVITDANRITFIQPNDYLVRNQNGDWIEHRIAQIGTDLSNSPGIHVQLAGTDSIIHLDLLREWVDSNDAFVYGRRTQTFAELQAVDYEL